MHHAVAPVLLRLQALSNALCGLFAAKPRAATRSALSPPPLLTVNDIVAAFVAATKEISSLRLLPDTVRRSVGRICDVR